MNGVRYFSQGKSERNAGTPHAFRVRTELGGAGRYPAGLPNNQQPIIPNQSQRRPLPPKPALSAAEVETSPSASSKTFGCPVGRASRSAQSCETLDLQNRLTNNEQLRCDPRRAPEPVVIALPNDGFARAGAQAGPLAVVVLVEPVDTAPGTGADDV